MSWFRAHISPVNDSKHSREPKAQAKKFERFSIESYEKHATFASYPLVLSRFPNRTFSQVGRFLSAAPVYERLQTLASAKGASGKNFERSSLGCSKIAKKICSFGSHLLVFQGVLNVRALE